MRRVLAAKDFARIFGAEEKRVSQLISKKLERLNFGYEVLEGKKRDAVMLEVAKALDADLPVSGKARIDRWEDGWAENLELFVKSGYDTRALIPKYYESGNNRVMRLEGEYALPESKTFEIDFLEVLRVWVAHEFFTPYDNVYEFGCGPAHNLVGFAEVFPEKNYFGTDWATSSQKIIQEIAKHRKLKIAGARFNFFEPDAALKIPPSTAVITFGALEQTGDKFGATLDYLLKQKPSLCLHIEPFYEMYDQERIFDYLGARYSEKRGYLKGLLPRLRELESRGEIKIVHQKKILGSQYHDGWSAVAWRPASGGSNG